MSGVYKVRYPMTIYHNFYLYIFLSKDNKPNKQNKILSQRRLIGGYWCATSYLCAVVIDTCAQSVVHCLETVCGTLECSLDKAGSTQPEISFTAMSTCERCFYFSSSQ